MTTWISVRPGTSTPWKNPAVANNVVASSAANARSSAGLGRSRWVRIGTSTRSTQRLGGGVHRLPAREQRQRAPAGGGDQRHQLVVDGVAVPRMRGSGSDIAQYSRALCS